MSAPPLSVGEAMEDFAASPDLVLMCRCGHPMRPAEMFRVPPGPGNSAATRIGCAVCYWAAVGPFGGPGS